MAEQDTANYEDISSFTLTPERERELVEAQIECTFSWVSSQGQPVGVTMNYVARDGSIWLTAVRERARIRALQRNPRASVAISSAGTNLGSGKTITYIGDVVLHEDQATKDWFYPALGAIISPYPAPTVEAAIAQLDTPSRLILELVPRRSISFDLESLAGQGG